MSDCRRTHLSRIMAEAWGWFRQVGGTFADALRVAWRAHKVRVSPQVILHQVKPSRRPVASPLANTAYLAARNDARQAAWYGGRIANW